MMRLGVRACWVAIAVGLVSSIQVSASSPAGAAASTIAACELWASDAPRQDVSSWLKSVLVGLFELRAPNEASASAPTEDELYFTTASDFSSQPICTDDGAAGRTNHLYHPIGIIVRKLGEATLDDELYWLVETEYGLKTYIRESHLSLLRKDLVYIFANTVTIKKFYCLRQSEEACTATEHIRNRHISPQSRFAVATASEFNRRGYGGRNYLLLADDLRCGLIHVGIYASNSNSGQEPRREDRGRITTCIEPSVPVTENGSAVESPPVQLDPAIKVVRWEDYAAYFTKKIDSAVLRPEPGILSKVGPEFGSQKPCDATLTFQEGTDYKLEGKGGLKLDIKYLAAIELGGSAAKTHLRSFKRVYPADIAISVQAYNLATTDVSANAVPILTRYGCETQASAPQAAYEIRVSHPLLGTPADFIINVSKLAIDKDQSDVLAVVSDKSTLFNEGFVYLIEGARDYFSVRDKISGILLRVSYDKMERFYKGSDELYFSRVSNFLTHLIIAATGKPGRRVRN